MNIWARRRSQADVTDRSTNPKSPATPYPTVADNPLECSQILARIHLEDYSNSSLVSISDIPPDVLESSQTYRRLSRSSVGSFLPPDYSTLAPKAPAAPIFPREDEGKEVLPGYKPAVYKEGFALRKLELLSPYALATQRQWCPVYLQLNNTQLNIFSIIPTKSFLAELPQEDFDPTPESHKQGLSYFTSSIPEPTPLSDHLNSQIPSSRFLPRSQPFSSNSPLSSLAHNASVCNGQYRILKLLRSYTLQYAELGSATDYSKRSFVLRVRAEAEQFMLQLANPIDCISWAHSLQSGIDVALPLDERQLPKNRLIPRRNRRRTHTRSSSQDASPQDLAHMQADTSLDAYAYLQYVGVGSNPSQTQNTFGDTNFPSSNLSSLYLHNPYSSNTCSSFASGTRLSNVSPTQVSVSDYYSRMYQREPLTFCLTKKQRLHLEQARNRNLSVSTSPPEPSEPTTTNSSRSRISRFVQKLSPKIQRNPSLSQQSTSSTAQDQRAHGYIPVKYSSSKALPLQNSAAETVTASAASITSALTVTPQQGSIIPIISADPAQESLSPLHSADSCGSANSNAFSSDNSVSSESAVSSSSSMTSVCSDDEVDIESSTAKPDSYESNDRMITDSADQENLSESILDEYLSPSMDINNHPESTTREENLQTDEGLDSIIGHYQTEEEESNQHVDTLNNVGPCESLNTAYHDEDEEEEEEEEEDIVLLEELQNVIFYNDMNTTNQSDVVVNPLSIESNNAQEDSQQSPSTLSDTDHDPHYTDYPIYDNSIDSSQEDDDDDDDDAKWSPTHPSESIKLVLRCLKSLPAHASWINKVAILENQKYIIKKDNFVRVKGICV